MIEADRMQPPNPTQPAEPSRKRRHSGCLFELLETVALTVVIFLGIQTFIAQPYQVEQESMAVTLLPGQYVLVDKLTPRWTAYSRGDIVVFDPPAAFVSTRRAPLIKRVIGLPGDEIELRGGLVYVNGTKLAEPYVFTDDGVGGTDPARGDASRWTVAPGELFVMGDHRNVSEDSRVFGPIERAHVVGRAWLRYWPINSFEILGSSRTSSVP